MLFYYKKLIIFERKEYKFKMYFSTILLLLLTSKCIYSMNYHEQNDLQQEIQRELQEDVQSEEQEIRSEQEEILKEPQEDDMIPFTYSYTNETKMFLKKIKKKFYITSLGQIKLLASSLNCSLKSKVPDGKFNLKIYNIFFQVILTSFKSIDRSE